MATHETDRTENNDAELRIHSDVARLIDLDRLEKGVMGAVRQQGDAVGGINRRLDELRDELSGYVVQHASHHADQARDWEHRWSGMATEIAYRKGLISWPRLVLEWLRQYLPTLLTVGALLATILGFATGAVQIEVRP